MSTLNMRYVAALLLVFPSLALLTWLALWPDYGWYDGALTLVLEKQQQFYNEMKATLSQMADTSGVSGTWTLVVGAFLYGVFHAAGPGHGKVILSTYLLAQPETLNRSLMLATLSALLQGVTAITLVYGLFYLLDMVPKETRAAVLWSERASYMLIMGIGIWLAWRGVNAVRSLKGSSKPAAACGHHDHLGHAHHEHAHDHGHHHHDHVCSTCGHAHIPSPAQSAAATDWRSALGVVFSIGLRPCTGAVLVLVFARFAGIPWAGMLAVLAMSIGTAMTVSALALTAVYLRDAATRLAGTSGKSLSLLAGFAMLAAGALFVALGYGLIVASFAPAGRSMGL